MTTKDSVGQKIARKFITEPDTKLYIRGTGWCSEAEVAAIIDAELAAEPCPHAPQTCQQIMDDYRAVEQYVVDVKRLLHLPDNCVLGVSVDSIRENIRKELEAELARERDAWVSVKERLPELTEKDWTGNPQRRVFFVLAKHPEHVFEGTFSINILPVFWPIGGNGYGVEDVTHWMPRPLPAPPACGS